MRASATILHEPLPTPEAAYHEALLISIHGPVIPPNVREILNRHGGCQSVIPIQVIGASSAP